MSLSPKIIYLFQLQLDRIKSKPSLLHASGPRKPSLSETESKGRHL